MDNLFSYNWYEPSTPLTSVLLNPLLWAALLGLWFYFFKFGNGPKPQRFRKFDSKTNKPGDFTADGNPKGSDAEDRVRRDMELAGYKLMDQSTGLVVRAKYGAEGNPRKITPDIIVYAYQGKPLKMIVEYDGAKWHGGSEHGQSVNYAKIVDDCERNQRYAELGYHVVRIRAGSEFFLPDHDLDRNPIEAPYARITRENDVVLYDQYDPQKDRRRVMAKLTQVTQTKPLPPSRWSEQVEKLFDYVEQERAMRQM